LVISVPKRLVRLAVRRNAAKRVARESWRHAAATDRARLRPPAILVRLIRSPVGTLPAADVSGEAGSARGLALDPAQARTQAQTQSQTEANTPPGNTQTTARKRRRVATPVAPPLPLATFKRLLRADLDAIWAGRFRPSNRRGPGRGGAAPATS